MTWQQEWSAIAVRIERLTRTCENVNNALNRAPGDPLGIVRKRVTPECFAVEKAVRDFIDRYRVVLPTEGLAVLEEFRRTDWFTADPAVINANLVSVTALETLRAEFEYLARDTEAEAQSRTELAFEHLRRTLLVDDQIRKKWLDVYEVTRSAELSCEQLGAVHLLSHGIVAFKVSGERSITDLVLNEPLPPDAPVIRRAARGLALTEWKTSIASAGQSNGDGFAG